MAGLTSLPSYPKMGYAPAVQSLWHHGRNPMRGGGLSASTMAAAAGHVAPKIGALFGQPAMGPDVSSVGMWPSNSDPSIMAAIDQRLSSGASSHCGEQSKHCSIESLCEPQESLLNVDTLLANLQGFSTLQYLLKATNNGLIPAESAEVTTTAASADGAGGFEQTAVAPTTPPGLQATFENQEEGSDSCTADNCAPKSKGAPVAELV
eukprot:Selendium_serpulae@DN2485_c0_g1_i3.p1